MGMGIVGGMWAGRRANQNQSWHNCMQFLSPRGQMPRQMKLNNDDDDDGDPVGKRIRIMVSGYWITGQ